MQQDGNSVYIVQEYVDGQDLAGWAAAVNPDSMQIVRLMIEIVEAVGFAHQHGLVHRDLKPGNILVDQRGQLCVSDPGRSGIADPVRASLPGPRRVEPRSLSIACARATDDHGRFALVLALGDYPLSDALDVAST